MARTSLDEQLERTISAKTLAGTEGGLGARESLGDLTRGSTVGRCVVLDRLGSGGMGVVYDAWYPQLDRKLALELLHRPGEAHPSQGRG